MGQHTFELPNSSSSDLVDRIWRDLPYLPRAVAQLVYFLEAGESIGDLLSKNEAELATGVLADTLPARSAFTATYGLPWKAAHLLFTTVVDHVAGHPTPQPGDRIYYELCAQMLYRLGYVDGLAGAHVALVEHNPGAELSAPQPGSEKERRIVEAVRGVNEQILQPAYWSGFEYGSTEAYLKNLHPELLGAINARALILLETNSGSVEDVAAELAGLVKERELELEVNDIEKALLYVENRVLEIRQTRAHHAVQRYLVNESPVSPLAIASVIRVLAQELQRPDNPNQRVREDELDEAIILAATLGFLPDTINALFEPVLEDTVVNIVSKSTRDYHWADVARQIVNGLNEVAPAGHLWPIRRAGIPRRLSERKPERFRLSNQEELRALIRTIQCGLRGTNVVEDAKSYRALLHRMRAPSAVAGDLLALYLLPRCEFELRADPTAFVRAELAASREVEPNLWAHVERRLMRRFASASAMSLLNAWDPTGACRSAAEAELARDGRLQDAELAESWVRTYRAEGAGYGADQSTLTWYSEIPRESKIAEGVLLLARARQVEDALEQRAWREAQREVLRHIPSIGHEIYLAPDAEAMIRDTFRAVSSRALGAAERRLAKWPRFGSRVLELVSVAIVEALALELGVVEEVQTARG